MEYLAKSARKVSVRSGGHFAVIGISEAGAAAFFCTHQDGELAELWQKNELQSWLQLRHQPEREAPTGPADQPAYKIKGLGKLKKVMASLGVITVADLAAADGATLAQIHAKAIKKDGFQAAVNHARRVCESQGSSGNASGNDSAAGAAQGLPVETSLPGDQTLPADSGAGQDSGVSAALGESLSFTGV